VDRAQLQQKIERSRQKQRELEEELRRRRESLLEYMQQVNVGQVALKVGQVMAYVGFLVCHFSECFINDKHHTVNELIKFVCCFLSYRYLFCKNDIKHNSRNSQVLVLLHMKYVIICSSSATASVLLGMQDKLTLI